MSTPTTIQQSASPSALRRLVARYPVAAFLIMAYTITSAFALPPIRIRLGTFLLGFELWDSLGTIFGLAGASLWQMWFGFTFAAVCKFDIISTISLLKE